MEGKLSGEAFDTLARFWPNYFTDYKGLLDYARDNKVEFIAANVPRRIASDVYHGGFENIKPEDSIYLPPLPIPYDANLPGYVEMMKMMGGHGGDNLPKAQAIKDATMGYSISENLKENSVFIHFNGTYHSDGYEGIGWYLKKYSPGKKVLTISTVSQKSVDELENENVGKADFIIVVDEDMVSTH